MKIESITPAEITAGDPTQEIEVEGTGFPRGKVHAKLFFADGNTVDLMVKRPNNSTKKLIVVIPGRFIPQVAEKTLLGLFVPEEGVALEDLTDKDGVELPIVEPKTKAKRANVIKNVKEETKPSNRVQTFANSLPSRAKTAWDNFLSKHDLKF